MLILGSKSPRRKEILANSGISFTIKVFDTVEDIECSDCLLYPKLTAKKKALDILKTVTKDDIVLCCDTVVINDGIIYGKPKNKVDAYNMIKAIAGKTHLVVTGVYLGNGDSFENFIVQTSVTVSEMSDEEINDYINTNEPYDKAGAYAIQGIFAKYIESINGDYYNVMGLPINSIYKILKTKYKQLLND